VFPEIVKDSNGLYEVKSGSNKVHGTQSVNNGHKRKDGITSNPDFVISQKKHAGKPLVIDAKNWSTSIPLKEL
jgi:hypothetical protein